MEFFRKACKGDIIYNHFLFVGKSVAVFLDGYVVCV